MDKRLKSLLVYFSQIPTKVLLLAISLLIWLFFASSYARKGDIFFHSDVARDYLVLADLVQSYKPTLIGPRAGGVTGYFHGPLWFYLNLPVFILMKGNPSYMAWWYVILVVMNIGCVYWTTKKLLSTNIAILGTSLFSLIALLYPLNMFNPYGAVLFSPLFFFFWCKYDQTSRIKFLLATFFIIGILIQFQIAFGAPVLVLVLIALTNKLRSTRQWNHLLAFSILVIPLSTYLVFDIRHDWLQVKALLSVLNGGDSSEKISFFSKVFERFQLLIGQGVTLANYMYGNGFLSRVMNIFSISLIGLAWWVNTGSHKKIVTWFIYFYIGFWLISLFFPGDIPNYYYWPFIPLISIITASAWQSNNGLVFITLFGGLIIGNVFINLELIQQSKGFIGQQDLSWKFYEKIANDTYNMANREFGYFIYTSDLYGYQPTYGMNFVANHFKEKNGVYFRKKTQTFLIIAPTPSDRPMLNAEYWKKEQVKIIKEPIKVIEYPNGYKVEEYNLSEEEIKTESDPNIVKGLFFR